MILQLLAATVLTLAPLTPHLPAWAVVVVLAAVTWRASSALRRWPLPNKWLRGALAIAGIAGVYLSFGRVNGLVAGGSLLTVGAALKLVELRTQRDLRVLVALLYFTLVVNFLFSQELWTIVYLFACTWLITTALIGSNHPGGASTLPWRHAMRMSGAFMLQALPLAAVLFILFPRIPGPLWGLPSDDGAEPAGLADSMAPGDIRKLVLSDAVAFRVHFESTPAPRAERYWRGPVFSHFDGRRWTPGLVSPIPARYTVEGAAIQYRIALEPSRTRWLFALDLPDARDLPPDAAINGNAVLSSTRDNLQRRDYVLRSHPRYELSPVLAEAAMQRELQLPSDIDPRTRALAQRWRAEGLTSAQIVEHALRMYRNDGFSYTLEPPPVGRNSIDDFLFRTRAGFCEHYAGSFTFLMRAAGIPARVVTGYQGGSKNLYGDYYVIRQQDAHAWSEVWIARRGWLRVDPTAAVSPARIDTGVGAALAGTAGVPDFLRVGRNSHWKDLLKARWDWVNTQWNRLVLGYGPELQTQFMRALGLASRTAMVLALTACLVISMAILGLVMNRRTRRGVRPDGARRQWLRATRRLRRYGLRQKPSETAGAFVVRVCELHPASAEWIKAVYEAYVQARYVDPEDDRRRRELSRLARAPLP
ncbi:MAG TPA: DUF3488 and transglutaminase-like domain-containing protein [Nevskiaceae bacterium]